MMATTGTKIVYWLDRLRATDVHDRIIVYKTGDRVLVEIAADDDLPIMFVNHLATKGIEITLAKYSPHVALICATSCQNLYEILKEYFEMAYLSGLPPGPETEEERKFWEGEIGEILRKVGCK